MFKPKSEKEKLLHRLKIIRGHIGKVSEMIECDAYCVDVLLQTKAIRSALSKVDDLLLEHHLSHCVVDHIKEGKAEKAIKEVMNIFKERKGTL
jgi:CsoR family transcriptional regulator, copper-sensing transcriptional repressor